MTVVSEEMVAIREKLLKDMHQYIIEMGDEDIYDEWITLAVPDEPTEEDFESIADDDKEWIETCRLFGVLSESDIKNNY